MILPVNNLNNNKINFSADNKEKKKTLAYNHDTLLENNFSTKTRIGIDKLTNAFTVYPAKGFKGSKNANFYEFLTMGTVPYLVGSLTLMSIFNSANKHYAPFQKMMANKVGQKLALGVLFYGLIKSASQSLINEPVKWLTGVDANLPYAKVIYELPDNINDTDITSIEHHKVFESVEFPRWDLLYDEKGENRNVYYDKIAKKLGMGENLKDSDQEVKPRIKEIIVKSNTAKNITSYLWAACGVGLAFQEPWEKFFNVMTFKFWKGKEFMKSISSFGTSLKESAEAFYKGDKNSTNFIKRHGGKMLLGAAALTTVLGIINSVTSSNKPSKLTAEDVINKQGKYTVN